MPSYAAIAETSETLVELLRDRIAERDDIVTVDRTEIALVSPARVEADSDVRLSLYLYEVTENGVMKNADRWTIDDDTQQDPPLALDLRYLLTAFPAQGGNDETAITVDQHRLLGLAMQVLYDNSIVGGDDLQGSLSDADARLHISLEPESTNDLANVWNTFGETPLYPSASYHVSPVLIDSTVERTVSRVREREAKVERLDRDGGSEVRQFDEETEDA